MGLIGETLTLRQDVERCLDEARCLTPELKHSSIRKSLAAENAKLHSGLGRARVILQGAWRGT